MEPTLFKEFRYKFIHRLEGIELEDFFKGIYVDILRTIKDIDDSKKGYIQFKFILEDDNGNDITLSIISELLKEDRLLLISFGLLYREYFWELNIWEEENKPFLFDILLESNFHNSQFLSLFYSTTNKFTFKDRTYVDSKFQEVVERLKANGKSVELKEDDWLYDY